MALIPLAVVFFAGGRTVFAKGIAASLVGLLLTLAPPNHRLPRVLLASMCAVLLAPLLSFLPQSWAGPLPEWRRHLIEDWDVVIPGTLTSQPMVTLEAWLLLVLGVVWLAWCASRGTTLEDRRRLYRILVTGIGGIAVLVLLNRNGVIHMPWWKFPVEFGNTAGGPFANRNHTSGLMVVGSVLCAASAYDFYRNKQRRWALSLPLLLTFFGIIITNTSRAGVLLFFFGITLWLWTAAMKRGLFKRIALASALVLGGISVVVIFGGVLSTRLAEAVDPASTASAAGDRPIIYSEAIRITSTVPWTGIGLGNFSSVFPMQVGFHEPSVRFLHPESDLFWVMIEGGVPLLMALLAVTVLMFSMTGPWSDSREDDSSSRQDRRLRHAAAIVAGMAVLHGIVDVPMHSPGYGLLAALLTALSIRPSRARTPAAWADRLVFRLAGIGLLSAGVCWLAVALGNPVLPGTSAARLLAQQALDLSAKDQDGAAIKLLDRAIGMNPLNWTHYFQRAKIRLKLQQSEQQALLDFGRARAIEPHYATMCYDEGLIWLRYRPILAVQAWKEFLIRNPTRPDYYYYMLRAVEHDPELRKEAFKLANTPTLKFTYLNQIRRPEEFEEALLGLLRQTPNLDGIPPQQRITVFRLWQQLGNRETLKSGLRKNLAWQRDGWPILAEELAREGDYEGAYQTCTHYEQSPISPSAPGLNDVDQLAQNFLFNPLDARRGLDLYFAQKAKLQWSAALATLEKVASLPNSPAYVTYEMASVHAQKQDFRRAWELMARYLSTKPPPEAEPQPARPKKRTLIVPPPPPTKSYIQE